MKRLSSLSALKGAILSLSMLGLLALAPPTEVAADHVPPDPNRLFAVHNGDSNADGVIEISDAVYIFTYLYLGGPRPKLLACEPFAEVHNGDTNGSGSIELSDGIYLLNWLFGGGPAPIEGCPSAGA
jgi:hypothetical protein